MSVCSGKPPAVHQAGKIEAVRPQSLMYFLHLRVQQRRQTLAAIDDYVELLPAPLLENLGAQIGHHNVCAFNSDGLVSFHIDRHAARHCALNRRQNRSKRPRERVDHGASFTSFLKHLPATLEELRNGFEAIDTLIVVWPLQFRQSLGGGF